MRVVTLFASSQFRGLVVFLGDTFLTTDVQRFWDQFCDQCRDHRRNGRAGRPPVVSPGQRA